MAAPSVQIQINDTNVKVFWETDRSGLYSAFKLYYSADSGMAGEVAFPKTLINSPCLPYSDKHIVYSFIRQVVGVGEAGFYLRVKGILAATGLEDAANPGAIRYIPALSESIPLNTVSMLYGYDPTAGIWRKAVVEKDPVSEGGKLATV